MGGDLQYIEYFNKFVEGGNSDRIVVTTEVVQRKPQPEYTYYLWETSPCRELWSSGGLRVSGKKEGRNDGKG